MEAGHFQNAIAAVRTNRTELPNCGTQECAEPTASYRSDVFDTPLLLPLRLQWLVHLQPLLAFLGHEEVHPHVVQLVAGGDLSPVV